MSLTGLYQFCFPDCVTGCGVCVRVFIYVMCVWLRCGCEILRQYDKKGECLRACDVCVHAGCMHVSVPIRPTRLQLVFVACWIKPVDSNSEKNQNLNKHILRPYRQPSKLVQILVRLLFTTVLPCPQSYNSQGRASSQLRYLHSNPAPTLHHKYHPKNQFY